MLAFLGISVAENYTPLFGGNAALPAMGVHVNAARVGLPIRLTLLVLLQAVLLHPAAGRTLRQRFDLSRRGAIATAPAPSAATDSVAGSEIVLVLKPAKNADEKNSDAAVDDLKFAVANEGMRPLPLQNFLKQYGMNPKARLPPLRTITPGSGPVVALGHSPVDMKAPKGEAVEDTISRPSQTQGIYYPEGYSVTSAPEVEAAAKGKGDLRVKMTTPMPPPQAPAPAPGAGPAPAAPTTTLMMMINDDAYAVNSVRPPAKFMRDADGYMMECVECVCSKRIGGAIEQIQDPTC